MKKYPLTILTPEGRVFDADVDALRVNAYLGSLGVLADHAPMLAAVRKGVGEVTVDGVVQYFALGEGTLEVRPPRALLLVDFAEKAPSREAAQHSVEGDQALPG